MMAGRMNSVQIRTSSSLKPTDSDMDKEFGTPDLCSIPSIPYGTVQVATVYGMCKCMSPIINQHSSDSFLRTLFSVFELGRLTRGHDETEWPGYAAAVGFQFQACVCKYLPFGESRSVAVYRVPSIKLISSKHCFSIVPQYLTDIFSHTMYMHNECTLSK